MWIRAALIAITLFAFAPARHYGFVNWDDPTNFINNVSYRGLSWGHFRWFFTTYHLGHYQPLNWLSFAMDHALSGLDPQRFHLTQILLHVIAVLLVHQLGRRLLAIYFTYSPRRAIELGAAMGATLFAIHPLRVESVVWLSARTDILAMIFLCLATLAYLQHVAAPTGRIPWPAFLYYIAAVLSKEHAVVFPVLLVLIDVYPLRRIPASFAFASPPCRGIWLEKIPFLAVSIVGAANAFFAAGSSVSSLEQSPLTDRLAQIPFSLAFYPYKTLVPMSLSHFYEFPGEFGLSHRWVLMSLIACGGSAGLLLLLRRRVPGLLVAALAYVVILAPVSGLVQRGPQLVADRYSYLACLPIALVIAAAFVRRFEVVPWPTSMSCLIVVTALVVRTQSQVAVWKDSETLWKHAIEIDNHNATAHALLAYVHTDAGRLDEAIQENLTALRIRPTQPGVQRNLAALYARENKLDDAIDHYLADIEQSPSRADSHYFLGVCFERVGDSDKASRAYRAALELDANLTLAHLGLARLFLSAGYVKEAEPRLRRVLELDPRNAAALELLAQLCANTGRASEAAQLYDRAIGEAERLNQPQAASFLHDAKNRLTASQPSH